MPAEPRSSFAARAVKAVKVYGEGVASVRALDGIDLDLERGRFSAIMGASGSGKSTLLHCMAGLDELTSGQVFIGDTDLATLDDNELTRLRRNRVGFVFQAFNLVPTLNAEENIVLPLTIGGNQPDREWFDAVVSVLQLGDRLSHRPSQLSGGQQQRVAAARALITRPDLIFADEPSGNLDSRSGAQLLSFLRRAVDEFSQTIVMVTHDPIAAANADRVGVSGRWPGDRPAPRADFDDGDRKTGCARALSMWTAAWKGLLGHRLRFALTAVSIALGVGLVAASYMFTDSLDVAFDDLFTTTLVRVRHSGPPRR